MAESIELAILGGGCAGLSLARELAMQERKGFRIPKTVIFEPREEYQNDRTWCFWESIEVPPDSRIRREWARWNFSSAEGDSFLHDSGQWRYRCLPSGRFYQDALTSLETSRRIALHTATPVISAQAKGGTNLVKTTLGNLEARMVVDTRPPEKTSTPLLYQQFIGLELEGKGICTDSESVGLMEEMQVDKNGFLFHYRLPFSDDCCLLEVTRFTPQPLPLPQMEADLTAALRAHSLIEATTTRREEGIIPMGLPAPEASPGPQWVYAGTRGGAVRPASGYAFQRIQEWAGKCARTLVGKGSPVPQEPFSRCLDWMDGLFLRVLRNQPELAPLLFMRFARHLSPEQGVRFLSNQPTLSDQWRVVRSFPAGPFLRQLRLPR